MTSLIFFVRVIHYVRGCKEVINTTVSRHEATFVPQSCLDRRRPEPHVAKSDILVERKVRDARTQFNRQAKRVNLIYGVRFEIAVQVGESAAKSEWVLCCPSSGDRVIVPRSESTERRIRVAQPACKPKRLETHRGIGQNVPKFVIVDAFCDIA